MRALDTYYDNLRDCLQARGKDEILIMAADANASLGTAGDDLDAVTGHSATRTAMMLARDSGSSAMLMLCARRPLSFRRRSTTRGSTCAIAVGTSSTTSSCCSVTASGWLMRQ